MLGKSAIIIGQGPAGISAGLYIARAGIDTTIIGKGGGALEKAEKIENYYGLNDAISGKELLQNGLDQAKRLGCKLITDEIVGLSFDGKLSAISATSSYTGDVLILATGSVRSAPKIDGISEFEGKGVSYCAVCDAFFHRRRPVAVLGSGEYALHEAMELLPIASDVTVLTNGESPTVNFPDKIKIETAKLSTIYGENTLGGVLLQDGKKIPLSGLFVAVGVASSSDLARKLGAEVKPDGKIAVNQAMATNIPGLYAAGDCTGGLLQIAKAVHDGAAAGLEAIKFIRG